MKNKKRMPKLLLISFFLSLFISMTLKKIRAAYEPTIMDTLSSRQSPYGNAIGTTATGTIGATPKTDTGVPMGATRATATGVPMGITTTTDIGVTTTETESLRSENCINLERQRLCGIEAKDWCRQYPNADVCQKIRE